MNTIKIITNTHNMKKTPNQHQSLKSISIPETPFVAFSVAADTTETYSNGDVIKFHHVISDVDPGFPGWNPQTSIFYCPYDGYYFFVVKIFRHHEKENNTAYITTSGNANVVSLFNLVTAATAANAASTMHTVIPCQTGEAVWVKAGSDFDLLDNANHINQFSGFLLKAGLE